MLSNFRQNREGIDAERSRDLKKKKLAAPDSRALCSRRERKKEMSENQLDTIDHVARHTLLRSRYDSITAGDR